MDNKKKPKKSSTSKKVAESKPLKGKAKKALTILTSTKTEVKSPADIMDSFARYEIPADSKLFNKLFPQDKIKMMEHVIDSIEFAHKHKLELIEVFQYAGTNFVVTISKESFHENIKPIYDFYIAQEKYELCNRIKTLINELSSDSKIITKI
jgi:hypothetical protein